MKNKLFDTRLIRLLIYGFKFDDIKYCEVVSAMLEGVEKVYEMKLLLFHFLLVMIPPPLYEGQLRSV